MFRTRRRTVHSVGYQATAGYDLVTGLGSVNAGNLAAGWSGAPNAILQLTSNLTSLAAKDTVFLIATATDSTVAPPTGSVTFTTGAGTSLGSAQLVGSNGIATATLAVTGSQIGLDPVIAGVADHYRDVQRKLCHCDRARNSQCVGGFGGNNTADIGFDERGLVPAGLCARNDPRRSSDRSLRRRPLPRRMRRSPTSFLFPTRWPELRRP